MPGIQPLSTHHRVPKLDVVLRVGSHKTKRERIMPLPAGRASDAAQDMIDLLSFKHTLPNHVESFSTNTLKSFSPGLVLTQSLPTLCLSLWLPWPMYRTLQNFMRFTHTYLSGLSRSLWMGSLPSRAPQSLVSLENLLRVHSGTLSLLPTKMLKKKQSQN